jgi:hypothetical protein
VALGAPDRGDVQRLLRLLLQQTDSRDGGGAIVSRPSRVTSELPGSATLKSPAAPEAIRSAGACRPETSAWTPRTGAMALRAPHPRSAMYRRGRLARDAWRTSHRRPDTLGALYRTMRGRIAPTRFPARSLSANGFRVPDARVSLRGRAAAITQAFSGQPGCSDHLRLCRANRPTQGHPTLLDRRFRESTDPEGPPPQSYGPDTH